MCVLFLRSPLLVAFVPQFVLPTCWGYVLLGPFLPGYLLLQFWPPLFCICLPVPNFTSSLPLSSASLSVFHHHHCHRCLPSQKHPPVVVPPDHHHWILSLFVSPLPGICSSHTCQKFFPVHQYSRTQTPQLKPTAGVPPLIPPCFLPECALKGTFSVVFSSPEHFFLFPRKPQ